MKFVDRALPVVAQIVLHMPNRHKTYLVNKELRLRLRERAVEC